MSAYSLELYAASLIRDGVYRQAWISKTRNYARIVIHGVQLFQSHITPFFKNYTIPQCKKKVIVEKLCETSHILCALKEKIHKQIEWIPEDWRDLERIITETWELNPSGPSRKFVSSVEYIDHIKKQYQQGKLKIR